MKFFLRHTSAGIITACLAASAIIAGCATHQPVEHAPVAPPAATTGDGNNIVARVNGTNITRHALIEMMNRITMANQGKKIAEPRETTRKRALDLLIVQELAFQAAKRQGLSLGAGVLDKAMDRLRADAGSAEEYAKLLEKEQMTEAELRTRVERNILIQQILMAETMTKLVIPEDELKKEYELTKDQFMNPEKITVTDMTLFLKLDDPASTEQANAILARIQAAKDNDPANLVSDGTFVVQSYELEKNREPMIYDAVRTLKKGELSGVIKTRDSIHIIKLTDYLPEHPKTYNEVRSVIEGKRKTVMQKTRRQEWERELRQGAQIEIMDVQEQVQ